MNSLFVIGSGVGDENLWTRKAVELVDSADRVLCTSPYYQERERIHYCKLPELMRELQDASPLKTAVLVGGDCVFYSIAKTICRDFGHLYKIELVNGIGSIPYLCARLGVACDDAKLVSLHGRETSLVPHVAYHGKVFALTGGMQPAHVVCRDLLQCDLADVDVVVGENLSRPNERICRGTPETLADEIFDDLAVVYVENSKACNPQTRIRDDEWIRGDVPMTKEEIRALALRQLEIQPTDIVYDIGAGTGAMAVEMARQAWEGRVYAFEMKDAACDLIRQNREKFGAHNLSVIHAAVPDGLQGPPVPDKVFIGGSSGRFDAILHSLINMNPNVQVVANAISPQSLNAILTAFETHGVIVSDMVCANIAKAKKIGRHDIMTAHNPISIISGSRKS